MKRKHIAPGVTRVYSNTLEEQVYFVSAAYHYGLSGKLNEVVYTHNERLLLRGVTKEQLKVIHRAKKLFSGELIESEKLKPNDMLCRKNITIYEHWKGFKKALKN